MRSETLALALRFLLKRILQDPAVLEDALKEVERLAPAGGGGRFFLVIDFKDARRAWCQVHAVETLRALPSSERRSFNLTPEARPE